MTSSMKSILTYFDAGALSAPRLEAATAIATAFDAHLSVLACGYEPAIPPVPYANTPDAFDFYQNYIAEAAAEAEKQGKKAEAALAAAGILSDVETLARTPGDFATALATRAQFADLVVLSPPYGSDKASVATEAFESALFEGDAPVLVIGEGQSVPSGGVAVIAYDGGREALRAVRGATPFLKAAQTVEICVVGASADREERATMLAQQLSRLDVAVELRVDPGGDATIGDTLARRVRETGADLLVMGGYAHSRLREYVVGGATRSIAAAPPMPTLFAH
ncbi:universal stress protein [Pikeienuella piscinae]|uniref:Universal stress protein n=1 Tax=Pikeienuella piscinae TaxID=2748098 RepID=A0A7L5BTQ6_9RHOB|nr:universal stress protein [Pikeienuella piscinae]QIE54193.1 universal stress protein [Pikeienuella piscinae]